MESNLQNSENLPISEIPSEDVILYGPKINIPGTMGLSQFPPRGVVFFPLSPTLLAKYPL